MLFRSTFCILACDVDRTRLLHPFESYPPLLVSCLFPRLLSSSMVRQAFQMDIKYILTTAGAAKLKRYYEHIFGVTAIFRVSSRPSPRFLLTTIFPRNDNFIQFHFLSLFHFISLFLFFKMQFYRFFFDGGEPDS